MNRRDALKTTTGLLLGGTFFPWSLEARDEAGAPLILPDPESTFVPDRPITAITLGAGARGTTYGNYAQAFPDQLKIVGVAEPIPFRNDRHAAQHGIPAENRFDTWEHVFARDKFADAVIIATPDDLHYGPCIAALRLGYDILLEKPISPSEDECREILALTRETGRIVAVCHVLRHAPYFIKMHELMTAGAIGRVVNLQHFEPIEHVHMSHSFVRGNWHDSVATAPIILAKSSHDLDMIRWLMNEESEAIQAFGAQSWFHEGNAPAGSTPRCQDGCTVEATCPYSALRIYHRNRSWLHVFDLPEELDRRGPEAGELILDRLRTTDYGRCVYRMDNDQCDHYVANIRFRSGATASFSMDAFTPYGGRRTRVMGSMGFIEGDMDRLSLHDFRTGEVQHFEREVLNAEALAYDGHGGGDWRLMANWVQAVAEQNEAILTSSLDASVESHLMAFAAERSRMAGTVEAIRL
jgi:predicted dehydrogenase